jgi:serine/threonine-protein kinase
MAPEQFDGRAVFASDIYSLGISMYQMLTGRLPYEMPSPSDLDRIRRGELVAPPRVRNPAIPVAVEEVVMRALRPDVAGRYQRAEELLHDILRTRPEIRSTRPAPAAAAQAAAVAAPAITPRSPFRTRPVAAGRFCWNCRKPLPARGGRCPFCGESQ